ncbi:MAG: ParB/RepB/Spo0J family partition protein [Bacteroidia bacterium]|nr:ParB/RepB/Spo0J family partition protein [Bacteroidia bacterium]
MAKKSVLGRGLGTLINEADSVLKKEIAGAVIEIELDKIDLNPFQPRSGFDEESLKELASSVKELGIIQPIIVKKLPGNRFQLISGERRFKAAKIAGLTSIPAFIRFADDQAMLELALVENIQREDLNPIEIALSYQRLLNECNLTQEKLSGRIGKNRSTIANFLRLLKLPPQIQHGLGIQKISVGHAKAILNIENSDKQLMIYNQIINDDLSVRKVENLVKEINEPDYKPDVQSQREKTQDDYNRLKEHLSRFFQCKIGFKRNMKGKGRIIIPFGSDEDLERIVIMFDKLNG